LVRKQVTAIRGLKKAKEEFDQVRGLLITLRALNERGYKECWVRKRAV